MAMLSTQVSQRVQGEGGLSLPEPQSAWLMELGGTTLPQQIAHHTACLPEDEELKRAVFLSVPFLPVQSCDTPFVPQRPASASLRLRLVILNSTVFT